MPLKPIMPALALMLLAGLALPGGSAEARSARYCATERALGRYPAGCPRRATPRPAPRPRAVARVPASPAPTHALILRSGCSERLQLSLRFRTARGEERTPGGTVWFVQPGETSGPATLRGRPLELVSDEIYALVTDNRGNGWRRASPSGAAPPWVRAPVSLGRGGAFIVTFCRAPGSPVDVPGRYTAYFVWDTAEIMPEMVAVLNNVAADYLRLRDPSYRVIVAGHAYGEARGTDGVALSRRRAGAVRDYLVARGVPAASIATEAWGDSRPAVEGRTEDIRVMNRRVEIMFGPVRPG